AELHRMASAEARDAGPGPRAIVSVVSERVSADVGHAVDRALRKAGLKRVARYISGKSQLRRIETGAGRLDVVRESIPRSCEFAEQGRREGLGQRDDAGCMVLNGQRVERIGLIAVNVGKLIAVERLRVPAREEGAVVKMVVHLQGVVVIGFRLRAADAKIVE